MGEAGNADLCLGSEEADSAFQPKPASPGMMASCRPRPLAKRWADTDWWRLSGEVYAFLNRRGAAPPPTPPGQNSRTETAHIRRPPHVQGSGFQGWWKARSVSRQSWLYDDWWPPQMRPCGRMSGPYG